MCIRDSRKLGQAQHIDQVIFVIKRSMPAVLDCLAVLIQLHFGIEPVSYTHLQYTKSPRQSVKYSAGGRGFRVKPTSS